MIVRLATAVIGTTALSWAAWAGPAVDAVAQLIGPPQIDTPTVTVSLEAQRQSLEAHVQARTAFVQGDHAQAMTLWQQALRADPANAEAWEGLARAATNAGLHESAATAWHRRLQLVPTDMEAMGHVGEALAKRAPDVALPMLLAVRDHQFEGDDAVDGWRRDALLYGMLKRGGYDEAAAEVGESLYSAITTAAVQDPPSDAADARWRRLLHDMHEQGVSSAALSAAMVRGFKAQELAADLKAAPRARARATAARFHSAALAIAAGSGVSAANVERYLTQAADDDGLRLLPAFRDPMTLSEALWRSALMSLALDHPDIAEQLLERSLELDHNNAAAANTLGWVLLERDGVTPRVQTLLTQALAAMPDDPAVLDSMGWMHLQLGNTDRAVELLTAARTKALEYAPNLREFGGKLEDPEILFHLAEALAAAGHAQEATELWTAALAQLNGVAKKWRIADGGAEQRRSWGLQVVDPEALYTHRFGWLEWALRNRLSGS